MITQCCENCRFVQEGARTLRCHRRAPSAYSDLVYYELGLLRDIARSVRGLARRREAEPDDDVPTEVDNNAMWPTVDQYDWCGEWVWKPKE